MKKILKYISVEGTENRKINILNFLNKKHIKYILHEFNNRCNIIIDLENDFENSKDKILLTAHYDVVNKSMGANDNGSSISILLSLIKYFKKTKLPIRIVLFDGEECGGIGSNAYIKKYVDKTDDYLVLNFDVCGCGDYIVVNNSCTNNHFICDNISNIKNINKFDVKFTPSFPFNDASVFSRYNIDNFCIVVMPQGDIDVLEGKNTSKFFGYYVWKYQHNGEYDDIKYINYKMMKKIRKYIKAILKK